MVLVDYSGPRLGDDHAYIWTRSSRSVSGLYSTTVIAKISSLGIRNEGARVSMQRRGLRGCVGGGAGMGHVFGGAVRRVVAIKLNLVFFMAGFKRLQDLFLALVDKFSAHPGVYRVWRPHLGYFTTFAVVIHLLGLRMWARIS